MLLRTKINLTVIGLFTVTVIALISVAYTSSRDIINGMIEESLVTIAKDNAKTVEIWAKGNLASADAGAKDLSRHPGATHEYITNMAKTVNDAGGFSKTHPGFESGLAVYSDGKAPPAGYDPRTRPWYVQAKKDGKTSLTEPYIAASTGKLILSFISPITHNGAFAGVFGADVNLDVIAKEVLDAKLGKTGFAFVVDGEGKILIHPKADLVMKKKLTELSKDCVGIKDKFAASPTGHLDYQIDGIAKSLAWAKIPSTGWFLCFTVNDAEVDLPVQKQLKTLLLIGATFLGLGLVIVVLLLKKLLAPLKMLCDRVADIAEGDGDLTKQIDVGDRGDEIGVLAGKLNNFIGGIRSMVQQIADTSTTLTDEARRLNATSITISVGAEEVAAQTVTVATASEEMAATALDIANNCHQAANSATQAAKTTEAGFSVVTSTVDGIKLRGEQTKANAQAISSLGVRSEQISEIVETIEDIADQTNLLALNAAIEAARAGESGRGFAVVADEVRKLSDRTAQATKEIGAMIKAIQKETQAAVQSMNRDVEASQTGVLEASQLETALSGILEQVSSVTMQVSQIATAAEEQMATTTEITNNISHVTSVVQETAAGAQETANTANELSSLASQLHAIVGRFKL
jgi:methyl-accepting chemotaxis protein